MTTDVDWEEVYRLLDELWDGPFDILRLGVFDMAADAKIRGNLSAIKLPDLDYLPKRFVADVWFLPTFLGWQKQRVCENNPDLSGTYENLCNWVQHTIGAFFGERDLPIEDYIQGMSLDK